MNELSLQAGLLEARDARQQALLFALEKARLGPFSSVLFISTNVPGPDKHRPGLSTLVQNAVDSLHKGIQLPHQEQGTNLLGGYRIAISAAPPAVAKQAAIAIEEAMPAARLLDIDVYQRDGSQVDRTALGVAPRKCLVCSEAARECILLGRHSLAELMKQVDDLISTRVPTSYILAPEKLAENLALGALLELRVTPKPGLVDGHDSGSHADLSFAAMETSARLLPVYFDEILRCHQQQSPLSAYVQAGIEAEGRMVHAIHSNAHKGYIFLSGLLLLAACRCSGESARIRGAIANLAGQFFENFDASKSTSVRLQQSLGGIQREAEQGLPAVFEYGWPRYQEALKEGWSPENAQLYLMAILMQRVEDTTAIRRCGLDGLARLRTDGAQLQHLLERQQSPMLWLKDLNEEYRRAGLTMGGVADCMALTFALHQTV